MGIFGSEAALFMVFMGMFSSEAMLSFMVFRGMLGGEATFFMVVIVIRRAVRQSADEEWQPRQKARQTKVVAFVLE